MRQIWAPSTIPSTILQQQISTCSVHLTPHLVLSYSLDNLIIVLFYKHSRPRFTRFHQQHSRVSTNHSSNHSPSHAVNSSLLTVQYRQPLLWASSSQILFWGLDVNVPVKWENSHDTASFVGNILHFTRGRHRSAVSPTWVFYARYIQIEGISLEADSGLPAIYSAVEQNVSFFSRRLDEMTTDKEDVNTLLSMLKWTPTSNIFS